MIKLTKSDFEKILAHAVKELPDEACGLIAGTDEGGDKDPKEQLEAIKDMRKNGFVPLGNWHSHPESPSRPSEEDKRLAFDSKASYMILSLMDRENPVLNSFKITGDTAEKEELVIE